MSNFALRLGMAAIAVTMVAAAPAQAVAFHMGGAGPKASGGLGDPGLAANEHLVTDFDGNDSLSYDPAHASGFGLFTGSHPNVAAAPAGDDSLYMAIGAGGSVLFDLRAFNSGAGPITSLSVYIGSVDPYNFIDVLGTDGSGGLDYTHPLLTVGGADLPGDDGDWYNEHANGRLTFTFGDSEKVGGIVFRSTGIALEFDSIAIGTRHAISLPNQGEVAPVPEPASWAMMLCGFGLVGDALRRRGRLVLGRA
ncbi:MAG: hypothetical protein JWR77_527 [Rhizorhabdus sp.]|nr:hypothetical protein [Rhizorhabdus sp.]